MTATLTTETALEYAATIAAGFTFHNARHESVDGIPVVTIDLRHSGEAYGDMQVWIENGPDGAFLYGEY